MTGRSNCASRNTRGRFVGSEGRWCREPLRNLSDAPSVLAAGSVNPSELGDVCFLQLGVYAPTTTHACTFFFFASEPSTLSFLSLDIGTGIRGLPPAHSRMRVGFLKEHHGEAFLTIFPPARHSSDMASSAVFTIVAGVLASATRCRCTPAKSCRSHVRHHHHACLAGKIMPRSAERRGRAVDHHQAGGHCDSTSWES